MSSPEPSIIRSARLNPARAIWVWCGLGFLLGVFAGEIEATLRIRARERGLACETCARAAGAHDGRISAPILP